MSAENLHELLLSHEPSPWLDMVQDYFTQMTEEISALKAENQKLREVLGHIMKFKWEPTAYLANLKDGSLHAVVGYEFADALEKARKALED